MEPSCNEVLERLSAFYDGELESGLADAVAAHLEGCEACGERVAEIARLDAAARAPVPPAVAPAEWARCWEGIAAAVSGEEVGGEVLLSSPAVDRAPSEIVLQAGEATARLVRRLIPLAASLLFALAAYGYFANVAHGGDDDTMPAQAFMGAAFAAAPGGL